MRMPRVWVRGAMAVAVAASAVGTAWADFELSDAQGRRILLMVDGTWR